MKTPDIMLLGGPTRSGKTSIAEAAIRLSAESGYAHLSMGDHIRGIRSGLIDSMYSDCLSDLSVQFGITKAPPPEVAIKLFEEFMQKPAKVIILDGFPRFVDGIEPFHDLIARTGSRVLGLCQVVIDESILRERMRSNRNRVEDDFEAKLATHKEYIVPTLHSLGEEYGNFELDGALPVSKNATQLIHICENRRQQV